MSKLNIIILCGKSPRHLYVANKLCQHANVLAIVQETGSDLTLKKILKMLRPKRFFNKAWRWLRDRKRYAGNKEAEFFFGKAEPKLSRPELLSEVPHINHPDVIDLTDSLKPDIIAVFGTSLLRGPLLTKGKLGIINLHGGLSPHYRGADCTFWALYNGEPDQVGCTLHYINEGIDTGKLIAHVSPEVKPNDDELTLFWRAVKESAEIYAEVLARIAQGEKFGQLQTEKGSLYQVKDRGWRHENKLDTMLKKGLLNNVNLPLRVRWFTEGK